MSKLPNCGEHVEILLDGNWVPATFVCGDYYWNGDDEVWWGHYFSLKGYLTVPDDIQSNAKLPEWRRPPKGESDDRQSS